MFAEREKERERASSEGPNYQLRRSISFSSKVEAVGAFPAAEKKGG